ncbi:MAG: serine hydrolase domain-containing protein [Actinomycetota bacterium]
MTATIVPSRLDALVARCRREVDEGRLPGYQLAVGFEGDIAYAEAYGEARDEQRFHTYSAVKPTVSLTVLELAAEGLLDIDAPVAAVLPSFGENGKAEITLSQVLLHAGGFPSAPIGRDAAVRSERLERYATCRTTWEPGTRYEYHPVQAHWVLGDMIEEVTGQPYPDVIEARVMAPAGQARWLAIPLDQQDGIVDAVDVGEPIDPAEFERMFGMAMPETGVTNEGLRLLNDPTTRALGHPGGGGITSASGMAGWYQAILHDDGAILRPEVREDALRTIRQTHEDHFGISAQRTHAFTLAGDDGQAPGRGHGHVSSPWTFGHGGAKGQIGWADPATGVSLGFMTNGLDLNDIVVGRRSIAISSKAGLLTTPE